MSLCPQCNNRPAKRFCPALRTRICAICCARERMLELACPESCPYLVDARVSATKRESALRAKEATTITASDRTLNERALTSLEAIEFAIVNAGRGVGSPPIQGIDDTEILAAIQNTIKNLETEESGLIYEHRAAIPRIDELSRRIRARLDTFEDGPAEERPRRAEILKALMFTQEAVKAHAKRAAGDPAASRSYIRFISLFYPWPEEATGPLIL
jgi:hypothetical protein